MSVSQIDAVRAHYPSGYRARRGLNWAVVGLTYTSFYLCRYNISYANKSICDEFNFSKGDISTILSCQVLAYGCGQIINGLLTDRIGGKRAMLIGAAGTVTMSLLFGAASFWGMLWLFALLWGINGYFQSYGAPGFIKINSAWFSERDGKRGAILVVNLEKASDVARLAEPFFLALNAEVEYRVAMTPEDLGGAGLEDVGKTWA